MMKSAFVFFVWSKLAFGEKGYICIDLNICVCIFVCVCVSILAGTQGSILSLGLGHRGWTERTQVQA